MTRILLTLFLACGVARAESIPPDITVAADGSGSFTSIQKAIESIPRENHERMIVLVKDGVYHEKIRIDASCITLRGESRAGTRIEFAQLNDDFTKNPDDLGRAVVNVNGDDFVMENLTVKNTAGIVGPHSFAVYGRGDRTVILDCDVLSEGADTVSLWKGDSGRYYHARCNFRGAVDFVCPRGWCYITDSTFYETKNTAAVWHDGSKDKDQKFVLRNCKFDGVDGWNLARHHHDAQFFFLDCTFSKSMIDKPPFRVIYPLDGKEPTDADRKRNADNDKSNLWGERAYFFDCHRDGGDYAWTRDNLPVPADQITAAWTFAKTWNPENKEGPKIVHAIPRELKFSESVTVKGQPKLMLSDGSAATYESGSGSDTLIFKAGAQNDVSAKSLDLNGGEIIGTEAGAFRRAVDSVAFP